MKKFSQYLTVSVVIGLLVVGIYFWKSFVVQIESYERGVVFTMGKVSHETLGPGIKGRLPYPIQKIYKVDVLSDRKLQIGFSENSSGQKVHNEREALTLTRYGNLVNIEMEVNYHVIDPVAYVLNVENPEITARQASEAALRIVVGKHTIDEALTEKKREIVDEIRVKLQSILDNYKSGISVRRVQFVKAVNPSQVIGAFEDVENAKQDSGKAYLDAQRYANEKLPEARGHAQRVIEEAEGYAEALISRARGDSSRFSQLLEKYRKYKSVTRRRLYLETMDEVLPRMKVTIVDDKTGSANLMPLGKFK